MPASPPASSPSDPRRDTPGAGRTQSDTQDEGPAPRLPHERDESADSEVPASNEPSQAEVGEKAWRDLKRGVQDTDRAPVTERVYDRLKRRER